MPILEIEIILRPDETLPPSLASDLADAAGRYFGSGTGGTWVKLSPVPAQYYAENDSPPGVYPVFVSVLKAHLPSVDVMEIEATRLTRLVARICARPVENVHIFYLSEGMGRVAFGGKLLVEPGSSAER